MKMIRFRNNFTRFNFLNIWLFIALISISYSCEKQDENSFTPNFSYQLIDDNHVQFTNTSEGEYYSLTWDFANGETITTTEKTKVFEVFYPEAGDYVVSLSVLDYVGTSKKTSKTISITTSSIVLSFSAVVDPVNPNYVLLTNTSVGTYDSFKWIYRNKEFEGEIEHLAYFPFSGNFQVELQVTSGGFQFSTKQFVNISQDDPLYVENMTLVWSDEFDGSSVNTDNWTFETGATGWGNNELQNYTNGLNSEIIDGKLIITAKKINENHTVGSYTSSRMVTLGKREFLYGRMEISAKLPSGTGIWPAIWMLGANIQSVGWPACGELDIMEYVGYQPNIVHATVHTTSGSGVNGSGNSISLTTCEEEFHTYGMIWTESDIVFYVDTPENIVHIYAPPVKTPENWPFNRPQFFILNVAVGGNWGGVQGVDDSIFPQSMEVDYVRVFQENI